MRVITVAAGCVGSAWILCGLLPSQPAMLQCQRISRDLVTLAFFPTLLAVSKSDGK